MSSVMFLEMLEVYRDTIGAAYPRQDVAAVIRVLRACAAHKVTTQDQICQATGLTASNLSKIVKRAGEKGWIRPAASRGGDGTKEVSLTTKGRKTFDKFESRCVAACSEGAKAAGSRAGRRGTPTSVREKGREGFLEMYNEDGEARTP